MRGTVRFFLCSLVGLLGAEVSPKAGAQEDQNSGTMPHVTTATVTIPERGLEQEMEAPAKSAALADSVDAKFDALRKEWEQFKKDSTKKPPVTINIYQPVEKVGSGA
ncbi:MAG: hypothetical protein KatS3mg105_2476 [Gemmatales bacterium]|nr:MAG: hypothetical protein KatS3mg105_2476 [Gemmatales bacterium]